MREKEEILLIIPLLAFSEKQEHWVVEPRITVTIVLERERKGRFHSCTEI